MDASLLLIFSSSYQEEFEEQNSTIKNIIVALGKLTTHLTFCNGLPSSSHGISLMASRTSHPSAT